MARNGTYAYSGDGGPATSTQLLRPTAVAVDASGNLYIAEGPRAFVPNVPFGMTLIPGQPRIRKVSANGIITTVAGNGVAGLVAGLSGDGAPATSAQLDNVEGVAVDAASNLYIADTGNLLLRVVSPAGIITTAFGGPSPDPNAHLHADAGVAVDAAGNIYVADGDAVLRLQPAGQTISLNAVANAASELPGPVAPGEIVVLRGSALGPSGKPAPTAGPSPSPGLHLPGRRKFRLIPGGPRSMNRGAMNLDCGSILFNRTIDQCRSLGRRGGRARARNLRVRKTSRVAAVPAGKPIGRRDGPPGYRTN